jgi:hypothetical protein
MKSMKAKVGQMEKNHDHFTREDQVNISREAMKKMLYDRIGEQMTEKLKKNDQE